MVPQKVKENPLLSVAVGIVALLSSVNIATVAKNLSYFDALADKAHVADAIAAERKQASAELAQQVQIAQDRFGQLDTKLNRVRAFTEIVPELKNLLTLRCMGTDGLDYAIARLKDEYKALTGENYVEPACDRLVVGR